MASTLTQILVHITFSTKERRAIIPPEFEPKLYEYTGGICRRMKSPLLKIGGTADHVHMLVSLSKTVTLADLMLNVKRDSSKLIREKWTHDFHWRDGYFGFSIGASGRDDLCTYIANQKEHHKHMDFKDEVRALLRKYGVDYDERYIWE
jgi:putative transposase